ncbi:hypothetical protein GVAV_003444 [Gurleya vavrai]
MILYPLNIEISQTQKIVHPINSSNLHLAFNYKSENPTLVMTKIDEKKDAVYFKKLKKKYGYFLIVDTFYICLNKKVPKIEICKKDDTVTIWDVTENFGGISICTPFVKDFKIVKYNYEYCLTISDYINKDDKFDVYSDYARKNYINQLFEIKDN